MLNLAPPHAHTRTHHQISLTFTPSGTKSPLPPHPNISFNTLFICSYTESVTAITPESTQLDYLSPFFLSPIYTAPSPPSLPHSPTHPPLQEQLNQAALTDDGCQNVHLITTY